MPFTARVSKSVTEGSTSITSNMNYTVDLVSKIDDSIPAATVDAEYAVAIDLTKLQVFVMQATVAMTIKTNDAAVPQESFVLAPNVPLMWEAGNPPIFLGDVTALFISNATANPGTFTMLVGTNS